MEGTYSTHYFARVEFALHAADFVGPLLLRLRASLVGGLGAGLDLVDGILLRLPSIFRFAVQRWRTISTQDAKRKA